jgi:molecular chaperone GrpE
MTNDNSELDTLTDELEELRQESAKYKDAMLRAVAETQNLRNRYEVQLEEAKLYSVWSFAKEMLEIADSLELALESAKHNSEDLKKVVHGVELIKAQLEKAFLKFQIEEIAPSSGDEFDCQLHHAISQVEDSELQPNSIAEVLQTGYKIGNRLIRPALVKVAA